MFKVAFFDTKEYDRRSFEGASRSCDCKFYFYEDRLTEDTVSLCDGKDVICLFVNDQVNECVIDSLLELNVKLIALRCAGYNNINLRYLDQRIPVLRVPAYSPHAVAEHALALIMSLNRKIYKAYNRTREGNFSLTGLTGFDLFGKSVGVIGTGKIGQVMISILKGFGMNILAYDLYPDIEAAKREGWRYVSLSEIYSESDVITLHCPLTKDNFHLIDDSAFEMMKDGVLLVNTSRGGLIDTKALIRNLKKGKLSGAGLDVYEEEERFFFEDHSERGVSDDILARLLSFNNVVVTSHQAFLTTEALKNIADTTLENIYSFLKDGGVQNRVE